MTTYNVSDLFVLHLDAGYDSNGDLRRCYVLAHAVDGFLGAVDEGYEGRAALFVFSGSGPLYENLCARILPAIEVTPSYRKRLLSTVVQAKFAARDVRISLDEKAE